MAAEACLRPTLYRYFGPRKACSRRSGSTSRTTSTRDRRGHGGTERPERLDAALRFIVDFQSTYSLGSLADIEPEHVLHQMKRVLPIMHERIARIIPGETAISRPLRWCVSRCATT